MFRKTGDYGTEKQSKAEQPAVLMEDELNAVVGGGRSQCEGDDGRGSGGSGSTSTTVLSSSGNDTVQVNGAN